VLILGHRCPDCGGAADAGANYPITCLFFRAGAGARPVVSVKTKTSCAATVNATAGETLAANPGSCRKHAMAKHPKMRLSRSRALVLIRLCLRCRMSGVRRKGVSAEPPRWTQRAAGWLRCLQETMRPMRIS